MKITIHGKDRIFDRTRVVPKDVLAILENRAIVSLGVHDGGEFLLFYSPFDHDTKIAIVGVDDGNLVSIWDKDFILPAGLKKVRRTLEVDAFQEYKRFIFERIGASLPASHGTDTSKSLQKREVRGPSSLKEPGSSAKMYSIQIEVHDDGRVVHKQSGEDVAVKRLTGSNCAFRAVASQLEELVRLVAENRERARGTVEYVVWFYRQGFAEPRSHFKWEHDLLVRKMTKKKAKRTSSVSLAPERIAVTTMSSEERQKYEAEKVRQRELKKLAPNQYRVILEVLIKAKPVYRSSEELVTLVDAHNREEVLLAVLSELGPLIGLVDAHIEKVIGRIQYSVWIYDGGTTSIEHFLYNHQSLKGNKET